MNSRLNPVRISPEFKEICNLIKAKAILNGRRPPSIAKISKLIAVQLKKNNRINLEELINDVYFRI